MVWADAWWRGQLEELRRKAAKEAASQYGAAFGASFAATYASIRDKARARLALKVALPTPRPLHCVSHTYLTQCIDLLVLESPLPHKTVISIF